MALFLGLCVGVGVLLTALSAVALVLVDALEHRSDTHPTPQDSVPEKIG